MSEEMIEKDNAIEKGALAIQRWHLKNGTLRPSWQEAKEQARAAIAAYNPNERLSQEVEELKHDVERQMSIANAECNRAERLREALVTARGAIVSLDDDALGFGTDFQNGEPAYSLRDEILAKIDSALSPLLQGEDT